MLGNTTQIEVMIMAAGSSQRLGQPKQLLQFQGLSLTRRIAIESIKANIGDVTIITGYHRESVEKEVSDLNVSTFFNEEWSEGLGSSIRNGLKFLTNKKPGLNAVLIAMVDQPYVDAEHLKKLVNAYDPSRNMIIASAYSGTFGVPVLVDNYYFDHLKNLTGDEGGKKIFAQYLKNIVEIPFRQGAIDIDQKEDVKLLD